MPFAMYGVFCFATFANSYAYKFIVPEAHFHADMIGASHAVIACTCVRKNGEVIQIVILVRSMRPYYSNLTMGRGR